MDHYVIFVHISPYFVEKFKYSQRVILFYETYKFSVAYDFNCTSNRFHSYALSQSLSYCMYYFNKTILSSLLIF